MKKISFSLFFLFLLAGCRKEFSVIKAVPVQKIISHPECSSENPPRIEKRENGSKILDICGDTSEQYSPFFEFPAEKIILFSKRNEIEAEEYTWSLRAISTSEPFQEEIISSDFHGMLPYFSAMNDYEEEEWEEEVTYVQAETKRHVWTEVSEGISSALYVFAFNPETREFISASEDLNSFGYRRFHIQNNEHESDFKLISQNCVVGTEDLRIDCRDLREEETAFFHDQEEISLRDFLDDGEKNSQKLLDCGFPIYIPEYKPSTVEEKAYKKRISEEYLKYFPEKIPCFQNKEAGIFGDVLGYFEANEKGKFDFSLQPIK